MNKTPKIFNEPTTSDLSTISATTVGLQQYVVDDFESLKCPVCGENLIKSQLDLSDSNIEKFEHVQHTHTYTDDIGQVFTHKYGRIKHTEKFIVHMKCPNGCVTDMTIPCENISFSPYKQL